METESQAYLDGYRAGRTAKRIGWKSDYVWYAQERELPGTYTHEYSQGYRAGYHAERF